MNATTGIYEFQDANGDGTITSIEDRQTIADLSPKYVGGFQNQLKFKRLQLDFLFQFVKQQNFGAIPGVPGTAVNQLANVSDISSQQPYTEGSNGDVITAYYRYGISDGALQDASYIRLKNVSLTYDLPSSFSKGLRCQLYLQGQNVMTFTKFNYGDPEFKFSRYLPPLKVFTVGAKLTF
jgi:hypothetical protein